MEPAHPLITVLFRIKLHNFQLLLVELWQKSHVVTLSKWKVSKMEKLANFLPSVCCKWERKEKWLLSCISHILPLSKQIYGKIMQDRLGKSSKWFLVVQEKKYNKSKTHIKYIVIHQQKMIYNKKINP